MNFVNRQQYQHHQIIQTNSESTVKKITCATTRTFELKFLSDKCISCLDIRLFDDETSIFAFALINYLRSCTTLEYSYCTCSDKSISNKHSVTISTHVRDLKHFM